MRRYGHLKFFQDGGGRHLGFVRTGNSAIKSSIPENPTLEQNMKWIGRPVAEISPLEIFPTWRWPPSWIFRTGNSAIRSAVPKTYPRTKHEVDRITRCRDMAIRVCWGHMEPPFLGEGKVVGGQRWHHSKERWWFPIGSPL